MLSDTFYDMGDFSVDFATMTMRGSRENAIQKHGATGQRWCDAITQDEVDALIAAGRLGRFGDGDTKPTVEQVNAANRRTSPGSFDLHHDGINRFILIETRAKRLGVWGHCATCNGDGHVYTEPAAKLGLVLWMLHPRKGCSRGVRVRGLTQEDALAAKAWLAEAAKRNAGRFSKLL